MAAEAIFDTPFGPVLLSASAVGLTRIDFPGEGRFAGRGPDAAAPPGTSDGGAIGLLEEADRQLDEYFAGSRRVFDLPLDLAGTPFQRSVWRAIAAVPWGETASYGAIAASIGAPNAYRAVGTACGANPVALVVPCHRIVGSDRGLHGFGGGLPTKDWLLDHEGALDASRRPKLVHRAAAVASG